MIFYEDTLSEQPRIEKAIKKYGYAPEHNFWWYQAQTEKKTKNVFAECKDGSGLLTIEERDKKRCYIFSSPIAPPQRRVAAILEYLNCIFQSKNIEKVVFELESELYKELISSLPQNIKARKINYTLTWPVYNLKNFDEKLSGNKWKALRKTKNKFYHQHSVEVVNAKKLNDKKSLIYIINEWKKKRGGHDRAHFFPYNNFIEKNLKGVDEARVVIIDERVCGINAGWLIPNSNRFYGAIGIHDYSLPRLGDVLYLEDLTWLKAKGYKEADMGGGEKALTDFKNKFHPELFYKTHVFSVIKK